MLQDIAPRFLSEYGVLSKLPACAAPALLRHLQADYAQLNDAHLCHLGFDQLPGADLACCLFAAPDTMSF